MAKKGGDFVTSFNEFGSLVATKLAGPAKARGFGHFKHIGGYSIIGDHRGKIYFKFQYLEDWILDWLFLSVGF